MWEQGQWLLPAAAAAHAVGVWASEVEPESLPLDELNRLLLTMRTELFGDRLDFYARCPGCDAEVEFVVETEDLLDLDVPPARGEIQAGDSELVFRPPSLADVLAPAIEQWMAKPEEERGEKPEPPDPPERDIKMESLIPVLNGKLRAMIHCHRVDDIMTALRIATNLTCGFQ